MLIYQRVKPTQKKKHVGVQSNALDEFNPGWATPQKFYPR